MADTFFLSLLMAVSLMNSAFIKKNWFMLGLILVALATVGDTSGILIRPGLWLKAHGGPDWVIVVIFFLSGLALNTGQIRDGLADHTGTFVALLMIFALAPVVASCFQLLPLPAGLIVGLFLVSVMPSTLSSGVVMTGIAGGNMAHALFITIVANSLAVITIPLSLGLLLKLTGTERVIEIDQIPIMIKIATLVLFPLFLGIVVRMRTGEMLKTILPYTSTINQLAILSIVWMALCAGREAILAGLGDIIPVLITVFTFHFLMVICGLLMTRLMNIGKKRRESVILMGGQKTLPLSVILQVSLFPEFGLALVVCVAHHIVHLVMDAVLVRTLEKMK